MPTSRSRALWELTAGFRGRYAAAIAALGLGTLIAYLGPLVTRATIDAIVYRLKGGTPPPAWLEWFGGADYVLERLWIPALLLALIAAASGSLMYLKGKWAAEACEGAIRSLRDRLFDHLQHLPCRFFDEAETGDLVQRCTSDVETVRLFLQMQVVEVGRAFLLLTTVAPIMLYLDVRMTLVSLAGLPLIVGFSVVFFRWLRPTFLAMDEAEGRMTAVLQENLSGVRVVRAFANEPFEIEKFAESVRTYRDRHYRLIQLISVFWTISDLMVLFQQGAVLAAGAYWVMSRELSIGTLVAFLLLINIFIWPIRQIGRVLTELGKALVALGRIREILGEPPEDADNSDPPRELASPRPQSDSSELDSQHSPKITAGHLRFEKVSFRYRDDYALQDVSFTVEPGSTLAIIGSSGSGKSTIVNLLLRLYDGAEGTIAVDGQPLESFPRKQLRASIAAVMQEPFLYSKTVLENITLGHPAAAEDEVVQAASAAAVHDAIESFREGYATRVGERGVTLSGGQKQRVALARALLQRPAILILDDALSAVDTSTESMILRALEQRRGQRTTLLIAHRLSTLRMADQVLVLEDGRVVEFGSHESLRRAGGPYQRLWELQAAENGGISS